VRCVRQFINQQYEGCRIDWGVPQAWRLRSPDVVPFDYYLCKNMKSLVYEMLLKTVALLTGHIFDSAAQVKNDCAMIYRAICSLLKRMGTYLTVGVAHFEQLF
jgi:hypothetical protein